MFLRFNQTKGIFEILNIVRKNVSRYLNSQVNMKLLLELSLCHFVDHFAK